MNGEWHSDGAITMGKMAGDAIYGGEVRGTGGTSEINE